MRNTISAFLLPLFLVACIVEGEGMHQLVHGNDNHGRKQMESQAYLQELVSAWQQFIDSNNWCGLIDGCAPIMTVNESNEAVAFDKAQLQRLMGQNS